MKAMLIMVEMSMKRRLEEMTSTSMFITMKMLTMFIMMLWMMMMMMLWSFMMI